MQSKFETPPIVFVLEEKIQKLEAELEKSKQREQLLLEAVEFYANTECLETWAWQSYGDKDCLDVITESDLEKIPTTERLLGYEMIGGKRARQCLKELGE